MGWGTTKKQNQQNPNIMRKQKFCLNACVGSLKVIIVLLYNKGLKKLYNECFSMYCLCKECP